MENARRKLKLSFHGRIIDHLGIQMYQSPTAAIAELIANSWDADAEHIKITLPDVINENSEIVVSDDGSGMTFEECENKYLNVGWCRRGDDPKKKTVKKQRPILGRKGIGKFAGFGIAEVIRIETTSEETGEQTAFELDIKDLRGNTYVAEGGEVSVITYLEPDAERRNMHGTVIRLTHLNFERKQSTERFLRSMARRFLLYQHSDDFKVEVNGLELPESEEEENLEFSFPRDYREDDERPNMQIDAQGWGLEELAGERKLKWRISFYRKPIEDEELRGISIFANGKLAQTPFFFNLSGGLGGQHGQQYMTGQIEADYLDCLPEDVIATERQRVNWEHSEGLKLLEWGQERVKQLLRIWKARRSERKRQIIEQKLSPFSLKLDSRPSTEKETITVALHKLASIESLSEEMFQDLADGILQAWDKGKLHGLIARIAESDELTDKDLLSILFEARVLTALNTAEAVRTKLLTIAGLKERIAKKELENTIRDYISENSWLLSPEWETFARERSINTLLQQAASEAKLTGEEWSGRIDLALSSGVQLLIVEFMRPGLTLDYEHITRLEHYVRLIRTRIKANTGDRLSQVDGFIIADKISVRPDICDKILSLKAERIFILEWSMLLSRALSQWREFLDILVTRAPDDERLKSLLENETPAVS